MKIGNGIRIFNIDSIVLKLLLLTVFLSSCSSQQKRFEFSFEGTTMGTSYSIKVIDKEDSKKILNLGKRIDSVLVDVNNKMSTYIPTSELSVLNSTKSNDWINLTEDLAHVLNTSKRISEESGGSFDITVGPLVNLWGFGPIKKDDEIPDQKLIDETLKYVGIDKIELDYSGKRIRKINPNVYCDLSAIAKGFGVDKVSLFIESLGIKDYMVEIGGEVRTKGKNVNNELWHIGISSPSSEGLQKILEISDHSIATSGDYYNYFEKDGVRYSHTIEPKTGKPITHNLASVTVIDKDCEEADAYATTIDVMGPDAGYEFALKYKLPVFMIVREKDKFIEKQTPQFEEFIKKGN